MGYESKLFIVECHRHNNWVYGGIVATFDLCKVPWDHRQIFKVPIDFDLYFEGNIVTRLDHYEELCCMAKPKEVISALKKLAKESDYRRYKPCIALLKSFDEEHWGDSIRVVHFGH